MVDNAKCNKNQDLFHFRNGCYILKGVLRVDNAIIYSPIKIGLRYSTHNLYAYHQETFRTGIEQSHVFGSNVYAIAVLYVLLCVTLCPF